MEVERVVLVRLDAREQSELARRGILTLDECMHQAGFVELRARRSSRTLHELLDHLDATGVEYWVRDDQRFSRKEIRSTEALRIAFGAWLPGPLKSRRMDWSDACEHCMRPVHTIGPLDVGGQILGEEPVVVGRRGEVLVHERLRRRCIDAGFTGIRFSPVYASGEATDHHLMEVLSELPSASQPPTRFIVDHEAACPACGLGGLSLDSMLYYDCSLDTLADFNRTAEWLGEGSDRGNELVVSRRCYNALVAAGAVLAVAEPVMFI